MDIPLVAIISGFFILSVLEVLFWYKYKAPKYLLYAYTNISTALLLIAMAVYLYDVVGELVWSMIVGSIVLLVFAVLCVVLKRPVFLPSTSQLIMNSLDGRLYIVETSIETIQGFQDELGTAMYAGKHLMIIHKEKMTSAFFDLKTGLAGEILQKLINYKMKAAIIGDFSDIESESFQALIRECNRGSDMYFVANIEEAKKRLT